MKTQFVLPFLLLTSSAGFSQTLNVHKTDGSVESFLLSQIEKITFEISNDSTFTDIRDSHVYRMVTVGTQVWMAENLAYLPQVNPSSGGSDTDNYYYVYGYQGTNTTAAKDSANYTLYGVLYNYPAAKTACPAGWHLPSDAEWTILREYLGTESGIKAKSTSGWFDNKNGSNSSGFNGRPSGTRSKSGDFMNITFYAYYWSSTEIGSRTWNVYLSYNSDNLVHDNREWGNGFSIRCLKD